MPTRVSTDGRRFPAVGCQRTFRRSHAILIRISKNYRSSARGRPSLSRARIQALARLCAPNMWPRNAQIEIVFVDNREIAALNRKYLRRAGPTDVIAFALEEGALPEGEPTIGSLVISAEMAHDEARKRGIRLANELALYVTHGLLHLAGYDDATPAGRRRMYKREHEVMTAAGYPYVR